MYVVSVALIEINFETSTRAWDLESGVDYKVIPLNLSISKILGDFKSYI